MIFDEFFRFQISAKKVVNLLIFVLKILLPRRTMEEFRVMIREVVAEQRDTFDKHHIRGYCSFKKEKNMCGKSIV